MSTKLPRRFRDDDEEKFDETEALKEFQEDDEDEVEKQDCEA